MNLEVLHTKARKIDVTRMMLPLTADPNADAGLLSLPFPLKRGVQMIPPHALRLASD